MQFRPQLRPDSRAVILARSRKLPAITVGGVTYKWSGAARTYVGPLMENPGEAMGAEDVEMAAIATAPAFTKADIKPDTPRAVKGKSASESFIKSNPKPDIKSDFPTDSPPS